MILTFKEFDGRGRHYSAVVDEDTGQEVGYVGSGGVGTYRVGGIQVSLFGGKYQGWLHTLDQCRGFLKGVEAVLEHMTRLPDSDRPAKTTAA
jgi:hypothetical protein